jgi:hypothetical protein
MQQEKMATEISRNQKDKGVSPQWSRQFCLWINL